MRGFSDFFFGYSDSSVIFLKQITFSKERSNLSILQISTYFLEVSLCFHSIKAFFWLFLGELGVGGKWVEIPKPES